MDQAREPPKKRGRPAGQTRTAYVGYEDGTSAKMAIPNLAQSSDPSAGQSQHHNSTQQPLDMSNTERSGAGRERKEGQSVQGQCDRSDYVEEEGFFDPSESPFNQTPIDAAGSSKPAQGCREAQSGPVRELDPVLEKYCAQLLSKCKGLPPVVPAGEDCEGQVLFCIPSVSNLSGDVDWTRFEFPGLQTIKLQTGGQELIWWCSCSDELSLQRSLFQGVRTTPVAESFFCSLASQCQHLRVVLRVAHTLGMSGTNLCSKGLTAAASQALDMELDVGEVESPGEAVVRVSKGSLPWSGPDNLPTMLVGSPSRGYAVIRQTTRGTWACTACSGSGRIKCWHVQAQVDPQAGLVPPSKGLSAEEFEARLNRALDLSTGMRKLVCLSRKGIKEPHLIEPELADILRKRGTLELRFPTQCSIDSGDLQALCTCGRSWHASKQQWVAGTIFHLTAPVPTEVEQRICECGQKKHYDGGAEGLINYSNAYLFSYETLNWYCHQFWRTKLPFFTMWSTQVTMYAGIGTPPDLVRRYANMRSKFQEAWLDYISLQEIDYKASFSCKCGSPGLGSSAPRPCGEPEEVTADGVLLGFNSNFSHFIQPWVVAEVEPPASGSLHADRILLKAAPLRQLLLKYTKASTSARGAGLTTEEYAELQSGVQKDKEAASILFLLDQPVVDKDRFFARREFRELLHAVASPAPTCSLLPASVFSIVEDHLLSRGHINDFRALQTFAADASVLHSFLLTLQRQSDGRLGVDGSRLIRTMLEVSRRAYVAASQRPLPRTSARKEAREPMTGELDPSTWTDEETFMRTGHYFPNLPVVRKLQNYRADYVSQRTGATCRKYQYKHRGITPGLLIVFCLKCGRCIGFLAMRNAESPRTLFEVLFTRWKRAPKLVAYDNGCHFHAYSLNREPEWARDMIVGIDALHQPNHKDCSIAYAIKRNPSLQSRNTVVHEQRNSRVANIKSQAAFMGQATFLSFVRYFLHCLNRQQDIGDFPVLAHTVGEHLNEVLRNTFGEEIVDMVDETVVELD